MTKEHWFDTVNKLLSHDAPRRGVFGALALTFGQRLGATDAAAKNGGKGEKNKGKKKGKGNDKKNGKRKDKKNGNGTGNGAGTGDGAEPAPIAPQSCSGGSCAQQWAGIDTEIEYCEFICRQCDGDDPRQFCIVGGDPNDPSRVAVCCDALAPNCCEGQCTDTRFDRNHCRTCGNACDPRKNCCDGQCIDTLFDNNNCGACDNACDPSKSCFGGSCICVNHDCPPGQGCVTSRGYLCDGQSTSDCQCGCGPGLNYCQSPVLGWVCQSNPC